jgi:hypothetical protein
VIIWLCLLLMGFFIVFLAAETLSAGSLNIGKLVLVAVLILIPCGLAVLWAATFRIKVDGTVISVCKCFGLVRFRFDVADITAVACKTIQNRMGQTQKITLYTSKGKKVPIETVMNNSEMMIKFIEENVGEEKFRRSLKTFR